MDEDGKKKEKQIMVRNEDSYSEVQLEDIITQVKPEEQNLRRSFSLYSAVRLLYSFCTCLRSVDKKIPKISEEIILLPPRSFHYKTTKTLVLDLDETLVHSSLKAVIDPDMLIHIEIEGLVSLIYVKVRPGVAEFLSKVSE